jgi:hypothetical protein
MAIFRQLPNARPGAPLITSYTSDSWPHRSSPPQLFPSGA